MGREPRQAPQSIPDSLPKRDERPGAPPDAVRGDDTPTVPPDSLPKLDDETAIDGGVAQHPVYDSDQEDRGPQDFEIEELEEDIAIVDSAERSCIRRRLAASSVGMTLHFAYGSNMSRPIMQ